jgi:hypothetical protein
MRRRWRRLSRRPRSMSRRFSVSRIKKLWSKSDFIVLGFLLFYEVGVV